MTDEATDQTSLRITGSLRRRDLFVGNFLFTSGGPSLWLSGARGRRIFEVSDGGLSVTTEVSLWGIMIQLHNGSAYFLPKRFFASRTERNSFVARVRNSLQ